MTQMALEKMFIQVHQDVLSQTSTNRLRIVTERLTKFHNVAYGDRALEKEILKFAQAVFVSFTRLVCVWMCVGVCARECVCVCVRSCEDE